MKVFSSFPSPIKSYPNTQEWLRMVVLKILACIGIFQKALNVEMAGLHPPFDSADLKWDLILCLRSSSVMLIQGVHVDHNWDRIFS